MENLTIWKMEKSSVCHGVRSCRVYHLGKSQDTFSAPVNGPLSKVIATHDSRARTCELSIRETFRQAAAQLCPCLSRCPWCRQSAAIGLRLVYRLAGQTIHGGITVTVIDENEQVPTCRYLPLALNSSSVKIATDRHVTVEKLT